MDMEEGWYGAKMTGSTVQEINQLISLYSHKEFKKCLMNLDDSLEAPIICVLDEIT